MLRQTLCSVCRRKGRGIVDLIPEAGRELELELPVPFGRRVWIPLLDRYLGDDAVADAIRGFE